MRWGPQNFQTQAAAHTYGALSNEMDEVSIEGTRLPKQTEQTTSLEIEISTQQGPKTEQHTDIKPDDLGMNIRSILPYRDVGTNILSPETTTFDGSSAQLPAATCYPAQTPAFDLDYGDDVTASFTQIGTPPPHTVCTPDFFTTAHSSELSELAILYTEEPPSFDTRESSLCPVSSQIAYPPSPPSTVSGKGSRRDLHGDFSHAITQDGNDWLGPSVMSGQGVLPPPPMLSFYPVHRTPRPHTVSNFFSSP